MLDGGGKKQHLEPLAATGIKKDTAQVSGMTPNMKLVPHRPRATVSEPLLIVPLWQWGTGMAAFGTGRYGSNCGSATFRGNHLFSKPGFYLCWISGAPGITGLLELCRTIIQTTQNACINDCSQQVLSGLSPSRDLKRQITEPSRPSVSKQ